MEGIFLLEGIVGFFLLEGISKPVKLGDLGIDYLRIHNEIFLGKWLCPSSWSLMLCGIGS